MRRLYTHLTALHRRSPGQIMVFYGMSLLFFAMLLGLAVDGGMIYAGRRASQTAADAAAMAGARVVSKTLLSSNIAAWEQVADAAAQASTFATVTLESCFYVNGGGDEIANCHAPVPAMANGVRVVVKETHSTILVDTLMGKTAFTTKSTAVARVYVPASVPTSAPFIVCSINATLQDGTIMDIIKNGKVNPDAVGETFVVHGPGVESCIPPAYSGENTFEYFKGVADQTLNINKNPGDVMNYVSSNNYGGLTFTVAGAGGCVAGRAMNNCVIYLPLVLPDPRPAYTTPTPGPTATATPKGYKGPTPTSTPTPVPPDPPVMRLVGVAPFYITETSSASGHYGKLLSGYLPKGPTGDIWLPGDPRPAIVRLSD